MKKILFPIAAMLFMGVNATAQNTSFGIKAGYAGSGIRGDVQQTLNGLLKFTDRAIVNTPHSGFYLGTDVNLPFNENISLETGVLYTQRGYQLRGEFGTTNVEFINPKANANLTSHYIDVPLQIKINLNGFQIFAGPQGSYLMNSTLSTQAGVLGFNILDKKINTTDRFNRFDIALTGGVGYQFSNGLSLLASYDRGLSRLDANKSLNAYNQSIKAGIGFKF